MLLNEQRVWNFLKAKGFNDYGVAGLMGNLLAESGLRPNNMEDQYQNRLGYTDVSYTQAVDNGTYTNFVNDSVGYGLAQWTYWTRKQNLLDFAKQRKTSIGDLETQLEFLVYELKQFYTNSVYKVLQNATSVLEASNAVLLNFERPANMSKQIQEARAIYGESFYNDYAGKQDIIMEDDDMIELKKGQRVSLSENFVSKEFDCHGVGCCSTTKLDKRLVEYLQAIRDHFKKPINITSAYRCEEHNRRIGGATRSYHMQGKAADIVVSGVTSREVAKYAESIGILGIGLYETQADGYFTHIDTRTTKAFWYGQNEEYRSTFGGSQVSPEPPAQSTPIPTPAPAPIPTPQPPIDQVGAYHKSNTKYSVKLLYLQKGDRGRDVQILQELLKSRGYNIESSGTFDDLTYQAVKDFQNRVNIGADGIVGSQTMEKLLTV